MKSMLQCNDRYSKKSADQAHREQCTFVIQNEKGLHTRPSTELVKCASKFKSNIEISFNEITVNAKSILGILMLAACKGSKITASAQGEDAKEALEAIKHLAESKFHIHY